MAMFASSRALRQGVKAFLFRTHLENGAENRRSTLVFYGDE
jgi:hypothetical protein